MGSGYTPGPWDLPTDRCYVDDGTMARFPSSLPGILTAQSMPAAAAPAVAKPPVASTIIVIGSPSPDQTYGMQFITAAECLPKNMDTIWLIEKTGYDIYGITESSITKLAPPGGYGWIRPAATSGTKVIPAALLVGWLNSRPDGSIKTLHIYSHGLRGLVALRYGWDSKLNPDYGLTVAEVGSIDPKKFAPTPAIRFDSCNAGVPESSGGVSVAQALADRLHTPVGAWTGRTSYADVNRGTCSVRGSGMSYNPFRTEMYKEGWSRFEAGGSPEFKVFQPTTDK